MVQQSRRDVLRTTGALAALGVGSVAVSGTGSAASTASPPPSDTALEDIPSEYLDEYQAAGEAYGLDWTYLAGIGKVESNHGRYNPGGGCILGPPTEYGRAKGPMQFIDSTWDSYGVDGDGDGVADPCNFRDAIPAAARYLDAAGAPEDYSEAIFAYNHSDAYVADVTSWADQYRGEGSSGGEELEPAFRIGRDVVTTDPTNVRSSAEVVEDNVKHTLTVGQRGTIRNGYVTEDGFLWWWVNWGDGLGGWSPQQFLAGALDVGYRVSPIVYTNTYVYPDSDSATMGQVGTDVAGYVRDGPSYDEDQKFWLVEYNNGIQGWTSETNVELAPLNDDDGGDGGSDDNPNVVEGVPYFYQYNNDIDPGGTCGNTSVAMLLNYYGWNGTPDDISAEYGDAQSTRPPGASWVFNDISGENDLGVRVEGSTTWSISQLRSTVRSGDPVLVWGFQTPPGHIMPVLGFEDGEYVCNDPAGVWNGNYKGDHYGDENDGRYVRYDAETFDSVIDTGGNLTVVYPE